MIKTGSRWRPRLKPWLPGLLALGLTLTFYLGGGLAFLERELSDFRFGLDTRQPTSDLVVVAIDPPSLRQLDVWPWPRDYHAELIENLLAAGVKDIAFDIDFSSPSTPEADARFEAALERGGQRIILSLFKQIYRDQDRSRLIVTEPLPRFKRHVRLASLSLRPAADGLVRQVRMHDDWNGRSVPSLWTMLAGHGNSFFDSFSIDFGIDANSIPLLSYADVLTGRFDADALRGKSVIVGATAIELQDVVPVPVYRSISGVLLHALSYHSLISDRALQRIGPTPTILALILMTFFLAPRFTSWSWRKGLVVLLASGSGLFGFSLLLQVNLPVMVDVTPAIFLLALLFVWGLISRIDAQSLRLVLQNLRLRRVDALMHKVTENSFDGILTLGKDGSVETANEAASRMFGYTTDAMIGRKVSDLLPDLEGADAESFTHVDQGQLETLGRKQNGSIFPAEVSVSEMELEDGPAFIAILRDVTKRKAYELQLKHQASHDDLTGLPNRTLMAHRLTQSLETAARDKEPVALLLLDLDRFKEINDTLGHHVGDALLCNVARRLTKLIGKSDTFARLGGDEFAFLLPPASDLARANRVAERISQALERPFEFAGLSLEVGGSIGIAMYPEHATDETRLLQCADVAMYMAKRGQTRIAQYDPEQDQNSVRQLALTGQLRRAIETNELSFHYQPKFDLVKNRVFAVEALARWQHPTHGAIPPDEFIAQAEHTGLIEPLTLWCFDTALAQVAEWRRAGREINVAINISPRALHLELLPKLLSEHLQKHDVSPRLVTLEITESGIMHDTEAALRIIDQFHAMGVRLSIDDFGTGYSSLAILKQLPVDELKIDKSFVMHMTENDDDAVIVRSTIDLAHNLGLKVVAEGIESAEHVKLLAALGCNVGQGYFFSQPLPASDFSAWLRENETAPREQTPETRTLLPVS